MEESRSIVEQKDPPKGIDVEQRTVVHPLHGADMHHSDAIHGR